MAHQRIKQFWINKINGLINTYNVQPDETDWQDKINNVKDWTNFAVVGLRACKNIYAKANQAVPTDDNIKGGNNYGTMCGDTFKDLETEFFELVEIMKTKIGVDPESDAMANGIPKWKDDINKKLPTPDDPTKQTKLADIPANLDLTDLLYNNDLLNKIKDDLPSIILKGLQNPNKVDKYGYNFTFKVDDAVLQNYKNAPGNLTTRENQIRTAYGLNAAAAIPNDWENDFNNVRLYFVNSLGLNDVNKLPNIPSGENLNSLITKTGEYSRIHNKLSGKVSDSELDNLLNQVPNCSHSDYDTIKQERDTLKTENTQLKEHECDCDSKVAAKEKEIITKIITDLSLSTDRERESLLEAVITEIKAKINPPACNKCLGRDSKISELEAELSKLKAPKSLKDLPISSEIKQEVIKISQELGLTKQSQAKLERATSYQELSSLQQEAYQEKLSSEKSEKDSAATLNYALGALSLGSLLILAWVLIKRTSLTPELGNKEEK